MSGQIGPGQTITGDLLTQGQVDTISVSLTAGLSVQFDIVSNPTDVSPQLALLSPTGATAVGRTGSSNGTGVISYTPTVSGIYNVQVIDGSGAGSYTLSETPADDFGNTPQTGGTISPGGTIAGTIGALGDADYFNTTLMAGFSYEFDVVSNPTTGISPDIEVLGPTGATVVGGTTGSNGFDRVSLTPASSGVYGVVIYDNNVLGTYTLSELPQDDYSDNQQTTGTIAVGQTVTGTLGAYNDTDWFATVLTAGHTYQFTAASTGATPDNPNFQLLNSMGATVVGLTDNGSTVFTTSYTATTTGTYDLIVSGSSSDAYRYYGFVSGPYSITEAFSGAATVDAGSGASIYNIPTDDSYFVTTEGANTIVAASGSPTVEAPSGNPLVFGNGGSIDFIGGSGAATVIGGTGASTIHGGSGSLVLFAVGPTSFTAGTGSASIVGGATALTAALGVGGGVIFAPGVGGSQISSAAAAGLNGLIGAGAGDVLTASGAGSEIMVAGAGAETLNASNTTGTNALYGGSGFDVLRGGSGVDYLLPGSGSETLSGGSGSDAYLFSPAAAARIDTITDFNTGQDEVGLLGYGASAAATALANASVSGSSTTLVLGDQTTIVFSGVTHLQSFNLISS